MSNQSNAVQSASPSSNTLPILAHLTIGSNSQHKQLSVRGLKYGAVRTYRRMVRTHAPGAKVLTSAQLKTSNPLLTLGLNLLQDTPSLGLQGHSLLLGSVTLQQNFQLPNADLGPTTPPALRQRQEGAKLARTFAAARVQYGQSNGPRCITRRTSCASMS